MNGFVVLLLCGYLRLLFFSSLISTTQVWPGFLVDVDVSTLHL